MYIYIYCCARPYCKLVALKQHVYYLTVGQKSEDGSAGSSVRCHQGINQGSALIWKLD